MRERMHLVRERCERSSLALRDKVLENFTRILCLCVFRHPALLSRCASAFGAREALTLERTHLSQGGLAPLDPLPKGAITLEGANHAQEDLGKGLGKGLENPYLNPYHLSTVPTKGPSVGMNN